MQDAPLVTEKFDEVPSVVVTSSSGKAETAAKKEKCVDSIKRKLTLSQNPTSDNVELKQPVSSTSLSNIADSKDPKKSHHLVFMNLFSGKSKQNDKQQPPNTLENMSVKVIPKSQKDANPAITPGCSSTTSSSIGFLQKLPFHYLYSSSKHEKTGSAVEAGVSVSPVPEGQEEAASTSQVNLLYPLFPVQELESSAYRHISGDGGSQGESLLTGPYGAEETWYPASELAGNKQQLLKTESKAANLERDAIQRALDELLTEFRSGQMKALSDKQLVEMRAMHYQQLQLSALHMDVYKQEMNLYDATTRKYNIKSEGDNLDDKYVEISKQLDLLHTMIKMILLVCFLITQLLLCLLGLPIWFRLIRKSRTIAFFHPYCNAGGGGERVLWRAIYAMQKRFPDKKLHYVIYSGDCDVQESQILANVKSRFNIQMSNTASTLSFIFLKNRWLLDAKHYPRFTLILQMAGGYLLSLEALWYCSPEIFVDTTGIPLSLPLFRLLAGSRVVAYVHYPTITAEMISMVSSRTSSYNNAGTVTKSWLLSACKVLYYKDFSLLYTFCGRCTNLVMANGSWTAAHLKELWGDLPAVVYPPCDVQELINLPFLGEQVLQISNCVKILSVGQIRPEKNHLLQLRIFAGVKKQLELNGFGCKVKLVIVGGCRDDEDLKRVDFLKNYAQKNLKLDNETDIEWHLNVPYNKLLGLFQSSLIGLHTMWSEHFGISVVEGLAAGNIMVAHDSAGPKLDIIGGYEEECGLLASSKEEYISKIVSVAKMSPEERQDIRENAQKSALRFSNSVFDEKFCRVIAPIII